MKIFTIEMNPILVPGREGSVDVMVKPKTVKVQGASIHIHSALTGDFLHIKDERGTVVFSTDVSMVWYVTGRENKRAKVLAVAGRAR